MDLYDISKHAGPTESSTDAVHKEPLLARVLIIYLPILSKISFLSNFRIF
jgi:hypothetical protein